MKIERGEVEELLEFTQLDFGPDSNTQLPVPWRTLAELCRTWLAVQDAPVVQAAYDDSRETTEVIGTADFCWYGLRVRLVRDGGE